MALTTQQLGNEITDWIRDYAVRAGRKTLVVGISGGIDSAVVSALCARTGLDTLALSLFIHQRPEQEHLSREHGRWLLSRHANTVTHRVIDLTDAFGSFSRAVGQFGYQDPLAFANSRARLRMTTLYQAAQSTQGLVVGTGNRVEDFGVGFFTKYGDGGVDISPIGSITKTGVWKLGGELGILPEIINAAPTDGLWDDGRCDQDQLSGLTYAELERAMVLDECGVPRHVMDDQDQMLLTQYLQIRNRNLHKMLPIPVFQPTE